MSQNQHHLPRFYLAAFLTDRDKRLCEYTKSTLSHRLEVPTKLASSPDFYSFTKPNGERDTQTLEEMLGRMFETAVKPVYKVLRSKKELTPAQWESLLSFIAVTIGRVPAQVENVKQLVTALADTLERRGADPEMISHFRSMTAQEKALLMSMGTGTSLAQDLGRMYWQFIHASGVRHFCTSDNPVVRHAPINSPGHHLGPGIRNRSIEVTFPISKRICILGTWDESGPLHLKADDGLVDRLNERTIHYATEYVYSGCYDEQIMSLVCQHDKPPFKFVVN